MRILRAVTVTGVMVIMLPFLAGAFAVACAVAMARTIMDDG